MLRVKGYIDLEFSHVEPQPLPQFHFHIYSPVLKGPTMPLELTITDQQKVQVTAMPDGDIDGEVQFTVTSGLGTVERIDNFSVYLVSDTVSGSEVLDTVYTVSADVDLGDGTQTIEDTITLHVTNAVATSLGLTAQPPVPK